MVEVYCTDGSTPPCPAAGDQEELKLTFSATDVRCRSSIASDETLCPSANSACGKDYAGQLRAYPTIRITDHYNTAGSAPCSSTTSCSATVVDLPFPVTMTCAATAGDPTIGGSCNVSGPPAVPCAPSGGDICDLTPEGKKMNVELGQVVVNDGGTDGLASSSPNTPFLRQGIYIP